MNTQFSDRLLRYVTAARGQQLTDQAIHDELVAAGWDTGHVQAALADAGAVMPVPPPSPPPPAEPPHAADRHPASSASADRFAARSAPATRATTQPATSGLRYLLMLLVMGVCAIALGALLHNLIDLSFGFTGGTDGLVTYATSTLLVALPVFAMLFLQIKRAEAASPAMTIDKWSRLPIQVTLVVAFLWGLFRLVGYVYSLVNGGAEDPLLGSNIDSSLGNLAHTVVTVGIAGSILAYWWQAPRRGPLVRSYVFVAVLAVFGVVAAGAQFVLAGPVRADRELSERIGAVNSSVQEYALTHGSVPASLTEIPIDHSRVSYQRTGRPDTYRLCGVFETANVDPFGSANPAPSGYVDATYHPRGQACFVGVVVR